MKTRFGIVVFCVCLGCSKPAPTVDVRKLEKAVEGFAEIGLTKKLDAPARDVFVDLSRWSLLNVDDRIGFARIMGRYCGHKNNSRSCSIEVRDYGTGRRLAKWSEHSGYTPD